MKETVLKLSGLSIGYDSRLILSDVEFEVPEGEFLGIIGPNGSGKTTLLRAISRVLKPKKGEIAYKGKSIWHTRPKELAKEISVVSQNVQPSVMTVEEFVLLGRTPYYKRLQLFELKNDFDVARRSMSLTNVLVLKDHFINQISSGEKQLVFIARALAQEPKLILLDEPTAHLDIAHKVEIMDLIEKLNRDLNLTVLMVLHDLNLAGEYCDRLLLLDSGKISKIGKPQEVLNYKTIEEVYKTVVVVKDNPVTNKPHVFLVPGRRR